MPASEAKQDVKAERRNGATAWDLLAQDQGRGFAKKADQNYGFWASLMFWQRHLLDEKPRGAE